MVVFAHLPKVKIAVQHPITPRANLVGRFHLQGRPGRCNGNSQMTSRKKYGWTYGGFVIKKFDGCRVTLLKEGQFDSAGTKAPGSAMAG